MKSGTCLKCGHFCEDLYSPECGLCYDCYFIDLKEQENNNKK
jgi:NMD protein affecting ribosome stability and mRNA decay